MRLVILGCLAFVFAGQLQPTRADTVVRDFTGTVTKSQDFYDTLGFGSDQGALDGMTIAGTIVYYTDLAPSDAAPDNPNAGDYKSDGPLVWFELITVSLNGNMIEVPQILGPTTIKPQQHVYVDIPNDLVAYETDQIIYGQAASMSVYDVRVINKLLPGTLSDDSLPTVIDPSAIVDAYGYVGIGSRDAGGATVSSISLEFDVTQTTAAVPAPSSAVCMASLFAMGLVASWWRRRSRRV